MTKRDDKDRNAKVVKITKWVRLGKPERTVWEGAPIPAETVRWGDTLTCHVLYRGRICERETITMHGYPQGDDHDDANLDWLPVLITHMESTWYLKEADLIRDANKLIEGDYDYTYFRRQIEIGGCITDGLAFVGADRDFAHCEIIGFEAKSDRDNYDRLYGQINAYLLMCDRVYLVIENKDTPKDLPFYVGVIRVGDNGGAIERDAVSLKLFPSSRELWSTLTKNVLRNAKAKNKNRSFHEFFDAVDNLLRKLIWNQFVIGFCQTYSKDYIPLSDEEKRILRAFYSDKDMTTTLERFGMEVQNGGSEEA